MNEEATVADTQDATPRNLTEIQIVLSGGAVWTFTLNEDEAHHAAFVTDFEDRVNRREDGIVFVRDGDLTSAVNTAHVVAYFIRKHWTPPVSQNGHEPHGHGH